MNRHIFASSVLIACLGAVALANHPATFVLSSGERVSGELSYKGGTAYTLNGKDYPSDQIAIIAFTPGDPSAAELNQIPTMDKNPSEHERHVFVTRSGEVIFGKIYHISPDGNTITYDRREGGRQDISADNLARVYVNPGAARSVYAATLAGSQSSQGAVATSGAAPSGSISVNANQPWTDTGVTVKRGDKVSFSTTGQVQIAGGGSAEANATPDGNGTTAKTAVPVPAMGVGGLIAKVGNSAPFPIGSNAQPITMPADGRLYLGVNDDQFGDNSGAFMVLIRR